MKYIIILHLTILLSNFAYSQKCVITNDKMNVAYILVPNPMSVAVAGYACSDITVTINNGELKPGYEPCSYDWYPKEVGRATVTVTSLKQKDKILGKSEFRVKRIPDPVAMVGGKPGGEIRKATLQAQMGIVAYLLNFDFDAKFVITAYTISIIHNQQNTFTEDCNNARFSQSIYQALKRIATGDRVTFRNIKCKYPDGRTTELLPIEFRIID